MVWQDFQSAANLYHLAIAIDPHNAHFQYALGYSLTQVDDAGASVASAAHSFLQRDNINAHLGLGVTLLRQENYQDAIRAYQVALNFDPNNLTALSSMALALLKMEHVSQKLGEILRRLLNSLLGTQTFS